LLKLILRPKLKLRKPHRWQPRFKRRLLKLTKISSRKKLENGYRKRKS